MKKLKTKILFAVAGALLLSAGAFTAQALSKDGQRSNLISANIEALADGESSTQYWKVDKIKEAHPDGSMTVFCSCSNPGGPLDCC